MARKVFISFLGASNYGECTYVRSPFKSESTRYIQVATLEYLEAKKWNSTDVALILLTDTAEKRNWVDNGHKDDDGNVIEQTGLKSELEKMHLPIELKPIKNLPNGNNEEEIWSIFTSLYGRLEEGDELYFDLTHGFRYLPMLVLVMGNYAKFLKGATVKNITYGNYEGRNRNTNEALIVDLMPLTALQDWTFAAADFTKNGNGDRLEKLTKEQVKKESQLTKKQIARYEEFASSIKSVVEDFKTCRGVNIARLVNINKMNRIMDYINSINKEIVPLSYILQEINKNFSLFHDNEEVANGFRAVDWCLKHGLLQQATTMLEETIVTFFAIRHGICIQDHRMRDCVNNAIWICSNEFENKYEEWNQNAKDNKLIIQSLLEDDKMTRVFCSRFRTLAEGTRNDINHAGMRCNPKTSKDLEKETKNMFEYFRSYCV